MRLPRVAEFALKSMLMRAAAVLFHQQLFVINTVAAFYSSICDALATFGSHYSRQQTLSSSHKSAAWCLVLNQVAAAFNIQEVYFNQPI